jgi:hypothetical protein
MLLPSKLASVRVILALAIGFFLSGTAGAINADLSTWTRDISEYNTTTKTGDYDQNAEIAVVGSFVHIIWQTVT